MRHCQIVEPTRNRRGSTLIIVLALLGLLSLLGIVFFTFAAQERENAEVFLEAAKETKEDVNNGIDHFLRNILVGPRARNRNSVLAGGRHSIVSNLIGYDALPHSGEPIRVVPGPIPGVPATDLDNDGVPDVPPAQEIDNRLNLVDSQVAHVGGLQRNIRAWRHPDVGYVYPDANNAFVSYIAEVPWYDTASVPARWTTIKVVIPSYMRPQVMRSAAQTPLVDDSVSEQDWYEDPAFVARSFRPHPDHIYISPEGRWIDDGTGTDTPVRRYLRDGVDDGIILTLPGGSGGFPFEPGDIADVARRGELGVWTLPSAELDAAIDDAARRDLLTRYELDVENLRDGTRDSIWMDLGFPVQEDPDPLAMGAKYTLLYAPLILDMDSLFNLNIHGNLSQAVGDNLNTGLSLGAGRHEFISGSNSGLSPAEINPAWGLMRPLAGGDFTQHTAFWGHAPANPYEQANMELFWLMAGRGKIEAGSVTDIYAGRWGDADRVYNAASLLAASASPNPFSILGEFPRPGFWGSDDDNNVAEGAHGFGPMGHTHPVDYAGSGAFYAAGDVRGPNLLAAPPGPMPVLQYRSQQAGLRGYPLFSPANDPALADVPTGPAQFHYWGRDGLRNTADDLIAMDTARVDNPLFDGPMEVIVDPERARRPHDEIFTYGDALEMHMSDAEAAASLEDVSRRVSTLATHAFEASALTTRQRFTTNSWDLNHRVARSPLGPDQQFGTADDRLRAWEYSADRSLPRGVNDVPAPNGLFQFPPKFGNATEYSSSELGITNVAGTAAAKSMALRATDQSFSEDPFRPQLRRLLNAEVGDSRALFGQRQLSVNHVLDVDRLPNQFADLLRGNLEYRQLTEHPYGLSEDGTEDTTVLNTVPGDLPTGHDVGSPVAFPPTTLGQQEYWARRDRQKMARDIYVLLYTLGGGNDNTVYTASNLAVSPGASPIVQAGSFTIYSEEQLRQMAQFAVNVVDALDRDDVITKFEYDKNLGDTMAGGVILRSGWNLDDDPWTADHSSWTNGDAAPTVANVHYQRDSAERGVVYGVEKQKLGISEALGIAIPAPTSSDPRLYQDGSDDRVHLFVELQNLHTLDIPLATSVATDGTQANWRLRRVLIDDDDDPLNDTTVEFLRDAGNVEPNNPFVVAASNQTDQTRSSDLYVDHDADGNFTSIAPSVGANEPTAATPLPLCDLDLVHADHQTNQRFSLNGGAGPGTPGDFMTMLPATPRFAIVLERRQNLHMPRLGLALNEWVEVDRVFVDFQELDFDDTTQTLPQKLDDLRSFERHELLDATQGQATTVLTNGYRNNLTVTRATYSIWQTHFDRDFTSAGELLGIPLFGPRSLPMEFASSIRATWASTPPSGQASLSASVGSGVTGIGRDYSLAGVSASPPFPPTVSMSVFPPSTTRTNGAGLVAGADAKFLLPEFPDTQGTAVPAGLTQLDLDNRWYRLFAFLQAPTRTHRMLGNSLLYDRTPGKINLNMMRYPEVLAGLMDERELADLTIGGGVADVSPMGDRLDWWLRFLQSRDVLHQVGGVTSHSFWLPGLPGAKPFKAFDSVSRPNTNAATPGPVRLDAEETLLRGDFHDPANTMADTTPDEGRRLFEVGTDTDFAAAVFGGSGTQKTAMLRHRLLSKLMNNTTTNSNVFVVIVTIGHFETHVDPVTGAVRIGGEYDINHDGTLDDADRRKVAFVIDRSEVFDAYDPGSRQFDWRRLVKHQVIIQ